MRFFAALAVLPLALGAPILAPRAGSEAIPGKYIAVLKSGSALEATISTVSTLLGGGLGHTYDLGDGFRGFSFAASGPLVNTIANLVEIDYIEPDTKVYASALVSQSGATWGISRISHQNPGYSTYIYDNSAGSGTYAYIIDTGIYTSHPDFQGRASFGANYADNSNTDGNGHGTHVAGTVGSATYGVAKNTNLIAVKVLGSDGSGTNSNVIAGINFAANDASNKGRIGKAVANMSLGGSGSSTSSTSQAAKAAVQKGLFLAVAAGNSGADASTSSPANEPSVCTVGATDKNDVFASFSNYGSLVDILAPGVNILSTWNNGGTNTISGTSMATPHIAGLGAYLLTLEGARSPADLCARIQSLSLKNRVSSVPSGTKNYLAYNGNGN